MREESGVRRSAPGRGFNPRLLEMVQAFLASRLGVCVFTTDPALECIVPSEGFCRECRLCHQGDQGAARFPLSGESVAQAVTTGQPTEETCPAGLSFVGAPLYAGSHFAGYLLAGAVREVSRFEGRLFTVARERGERPRDLARRFGMELRLPPEVWGRLRDEVGLSVAVVASLLRERTAADTDLVALLDELARRLGVPLTNDERWRSVVIYLCEETGADAGAIVFPGPLGTDELEVHAHNLSQAFVTGFLSDMALACQVPAAHPVVVREGQALPAPFNHPLVRAEGITAVAAVAIPADGGRHGALFLFGFRSPALGRLNLTALMLMVREIGRLRERVRLAEEKKVRDQELSIVRSLLRADAEGASLFLQHLDALLGAGLGVPYRRLFLVEGAGELRPCGAGGGPEDEQVLRWARESVLSRRFLELRTGEEGRFPAAEQVGVRALAVVPLVVGGTAAGVIVVGLRRAADLTVELRNCLQGIALAAARMLEAARLREEARATGPRVATALWKALQGRNRHLARHSLRAAAYAWLVARGLRRQPPEWEAAFWAGLVLDAGFLTLDQVPEDLPCTLGVEHPPHPVWRRHPEAGGGDPGRRRSRQPVGAVGAAPPRMVRRFRVSRRPAGRGHPLDGPHSLPGGRVGGLQLRGVPVAGNGAAGGAPGRPPLRPGGGGGLRAPFG